MRDGELPANVSRVAHRGQAIVCASDAVLSGVSLMDAALSDYPAETKGARSG